MKAIIYEQYGPPEVLQLAELPKPTPREKEILIRTRATTAHIGDVRMRVPDPFAARLYNGLLKPKRVTVLGMELAGEVEATGSAVTRFRTGDQVFAFTGFGFGAYAEYICLPEAGTAAKGGLVAHKPANLSCEEAAALPAGGMTALSILRKADLKPGSRILVYGASGSVGTYAVQLAVYYGASVTGVCSTSNLALVRSLGADLVIDYTQEDFTQNDQVYDVIFDAVHKASRSRCKRLLAPGGVFLTAHDSARIDLRDLIYLKELAEAGMLKPVIDRRYPLEQIVEAHRYVEMGHKVGNVVITIE